jgi:hypothetical protein
MNVVLTPGGTPVTIPVPGVTVAALVLLLLHTPPGVASLRLMEEPVHTDVGPVIAAGKGLTVTGEVTKQPVGSV